jgi:hypothetical protein
VRYVLRAKLGLVPDRDVKMLPIGEAQLAFPALERGIVQAASLTIPFTLIAKKMGYRELVDYDKAGVVYPYNTITTLRQTQQKPRSGGTIVEDDYRGDFCLQDRKREELGSFKEVYERHTGRDSGRNLSVLKKCRRRSADAVPRNRQSRPGNSFVPISPSQRDGSERDYRHVDYETDRAERVSENDLQEITFFPNRSLGARF